jgi:DNA transformation protein
MKAYGDAMSTDVTSIKINDMKNLGPATARMLAEVDIFTAGDLRKAGAVEAYVRLRLVFGKRVSVIALYAMEAALLGCHWRAITDTQKKTLKQQAGFKN